MNAQDRSNQKKNEIVEKVVRLLGQHRDSHRGSIHQDPYKSDFFGLFADAYNAGLMDHGQAGFLAADALSNVVAERDADLVGNEAFSTLIIFWREWTYAWARVRQLHHNVS